MDEIMQKFYSRDSSAFTAGTHYSGDVCPPTVIVSRGQTLFRTEGKGLGLGHRATCRPAPWSAYQSQHSIQSHDT